MTILKKIVGANIEKDVHKMSELFKKNCFLSIIKKNTVLYSLVTVFLIRKYMELGDLIVTS